MYVGDRFALSVREAAGPLQLLEDALHEDAKVMGGAICVGGAAVSAGCTGSWTAQPVPACKCLKFRAEGAQKGAVARRGGAAVPDRLGRLGS